MGVAVICSRLAYGQTRFRIHRQFFEFSPAAAHANQMRTAVDRKPTIICDDALDAVIGNHSIADHCLTDASGSGPTQVCFENQAVAPDLLE